jgi:hypothetical protein
MADRYLHQDSSDFQPGVQILDIEFTAGSSGAVPALSAFARRAGVASIVLTATGVYTVTLQDTYWALLNWTFNVQQATYDATHGSKATLTSEAVKTSKTVVFQVRKDSDSTAVALTSGDKVKITLRLQKSTAGM